MADRERAGCVRCTRLVELHCKTTGSFRRLLRRRSGCGGRRSRCAALFAGVDDIFQFLAGLEKWDFLGGHFHSIARLWIAAYAGLSLAGAEAAEATDFNFVADAQRTHDAVKDSFDYDFTVLAGQFCEAGNFFNEIGFRHFFVRSVVKSRTAVMPLGYRLPELRLDKLLKFQEFPQVPMYYRVSFGRN